MAGPDLRGEDRSEKEPLILTPDSKLPSPRSRPTALGSLDPSPHRVCTRHTQSRRSAAGLLAILVLSVGLYFVTASSPALMDDDVDAAHAQSASTGVYPKHRNGFFWGRPAAALVCRRHSFKEVAVMRPLPQTRLAVRRS